MREIIFAIETREEERALVAFIQAGNATAEEKFFADFRLWIQQEIRRRHVAEADVEDIAQHVMLAAFQQLRQGRFQGNSSLKTWLQKIVHGKVVDYWRQQPYAQMLSLTAHAEEGDDALQMELARFLPASERDPRLAIAVHEALQQMPQQLCYVLPLNRTCGYTIQEISRSLALTVGQVAKKLYKAEDLFRQLIAETNDEKLLLQKQKKNVVHGLFSVAPLFLRTDTQCVKRMAWRTHYSQPNHRVALRPRLADW